MQSVTFKSLDTAKGLQIDDEGAANHVAAALLNQLTACVHRSSGGQQVIQQQHSLPLFDPIGMHLHRVAAVFQVVRQRMGIEWQLARLADGNERGTESDRQRCGDILRLWERCKRQLQRNAERERHDPELIRFRWLLEELRVSQFAQELKTVLPVSTKRLEEQWEKLRKY